MRTRRFPIPVLVVVASLFLAACGNDLVVPPDSWAGSLQETVLVTGLDSPTQLAVHEDMWFVAVLAGAENDQTGQILSIDPANPKQQPMVVIDGLDKPTGVAVFADELWVMERRRLTRGPLDGTSRVVVADDMAFNGRSEGTLTVDGDTLLFNTSGTRRALAGLTGTPQTASGVLWSVDAEGSIEAVASGFKHAYAQTRTADGTLWTTELADGSYDGEPAVDEIVPVMPGIDHGWPACVGDNRVVQEFGGSPETCGVLPGSLAVFEFGATPTSIVVSPWNSELLYVSVWNRGEVVSVSTEQGATPNRMAVAFAGVDRPQHLVAEPDRLLLVDFGGGQILELVDAR
jgi:glucose/arabinose dehydrogenase